MSRPTLEVAGILRISGSSFVARHGSTATKTTTNHIDSMGYNSLEIVI